MKLPVLILSIILSLGFSATVLADSCQSSVTFKKERKDYTQDSTEYTLCEGGVVNIDLLSGKQSEIRLSFDEDPSVTFIPTVTTGVAINKDDTYSTYYKLVVTTGSDSNTDYKAMIKNTSGKPVTIDSTFIDWGVAVGDL